MQRILLLAMLCTTVLAPTILLGQTYFLQGSAQALGDDCYRLTPAINTQTGAVWYADQLNLNEAFSIEFQMNLGTVDANGADGICFILQTVGTTAIGQSGGGLGFLGFAPAFGIEFDTWQNGEFGDPFFDHIAMISDGDVSHVSANSIAGPVQASASSANIEDGQDHVVRITWNPETQFVEVFFDCELRLTATIDLIGDIFNNQSTVFWGFTASTGGASNNQTVCLQENILSTGPDALVCTGASIQLSAAGDPAGSFEWFPPTFLNDPNSQTPLCTPTESIQYTVTYTDLCGNVQSDVVSVNVDDLELNIIGPTQLDCNNPVATLTGQTNFTFSNTWQWQTQDGNFTTGTTAANAIVNQPGTYTLLLDHAGECSTQANITLTADFDPPLISITGGADLSCFDPQSALSASSDIADANYLWSSTVNGSFSGSATSNSITAEAPATFTVQVTNPENGCSDVSSVTVSSKIVFPVLTMGTADTVNCRQPVLPIAGTVAVPETVIYQWSGPEGGISGGSANNAPLVQEEGWYVLTVQNPENGCSTVDSVYVFSDGDIAIDYTTLSFPNVFSPNGDGTNDRWFPMLLVDPSFNLSTYVSRFDLSVYNRWGTLVHSSEGTPRFWEGRDANGRFLEDGVYYFIVDYDVICGTAPKSPVSGTIQLVR
ncbi:MAG: gliding motility-associated C-terminal domain-containing protein [Flavobacteriales bacterium]